MEMWRVMAEKHPSQWHNLLEKSNQGLAQMIETKQSELNFLFEEQNKELQRAAQLDQSQKDVELIVQRHLQNVKDLMQNACGQVAQHREKLKRDFWKEFLMFDEQLVDDSPTKELPYPNQAEAAA